MSAGPVSLSPSAHPCACSRRHTPRLWLTEAHHIWPKEHGGPESGEKVALCPTGHYVVHLHHLSAWYQQGTVLPRRRDENPYLYAVALEGWRRAHGQPPRPLP